MYMSKRKYILEQYQPGVVQNNSVILTNIVLEDLLPPLDFWQRCLFLMTNNLIMSKVQRNNICI